MNLQPEQGRLLLINGVYKFVSYNETNTSVEKTSPNLIGKLRKSSRKAKLRIKKEVEHWLDS